MREIDEKVRQHRTEALQLQSMLRRELPENARSFRSQSDVDLAAVVQRGLARDQALLLQAIDEPDRAVVLDQQLARELVDRHDVAPGIPLDGQQRLILLRCKAHAGGGRLAERKEASQRAAKRGQYLVFGLVQAGCRGS